VTGELENARTKVVETREEQILQVLYESSVTYLELGGGREAKVKFQQIYRRRPQYRDVTDRLREAEAKLGDREKDFNQVSGYEENREWKAAYETYGKILNIDSYFDWLVDQDPRFQDIDERLARALKYSNAEQLFERAQEYKKRKEWEKAIKCLEEAAQLNPSHATINQELVETREEFERVCEKRSLDIWYELGEACLMPTNLNQAYFHLQKVHERSPNHRDVANLLEKIRQKRIVAKISRILISVGVPAVGFMVLLWRYSSAESFETWKMVVGVVLLLSMSFLISFLLKKDSSDE